MPLGKGRERRKVASVSKRGDVSGLRDALGGAAVRRELTCCYVKEMISFTQEARTSDTSGGGRECEAGLGEMCEAVARN